MAGNGATGVTAMEPTLVGQVALLPAVREEGADRLIQQSPRGPLCRPDDWREFARLHCCEDSLLVAIQNADIANTRVANAQSAELQHAH